MKKVVFALLFLINFGLADQSIYISSNQLRIAKEHATGEINSAKKLMPYMQESAHISESKFNAQAQVIREATNQAKNQAQPLQLNYEPGEKYYIFSDKLKQDSIKQSIEYKTQQSLKANEIITYYNQMQSNAKTSIGEGRLLIFISFSMPKELIKSLIVEGEKIGAVFVLRGLIDGSIKKTQNEFYNLMSDHQVGAMINPELFKTFGISRVPSFVIYSNAKQNPLNMGCKIAPDFVALSGAVTIKYALEQMSTRSSLSSLASNYLELLDNDSFYKKGSK